MTGSSGFLGQHITKELEGSYEIHHMKSDLKDHKSVNAELRSADPEYIMHLGARTEVGKSFAEQVEFSHVNYTGSINLIENATSLKKLKNFIFASTMEVYGWQPISDEIEKNNKPSTNVIFDENTPPNPNAPYAVAKYGVEKYLQYANRSFGLPFTALRQTNAYGRTDNDYFVTEQIVTQMLKKQDVINLGYAKPYRNFIYVTDVIDAWREVLVNSDKCSDGKIFTIGPNNPIQIEKLVDVIGKKIGWKGQVEWNTKEHRPGEIYWLNSDSKLIEKTIGWKPKISLSEGLDKTIDIWTKEYAR
jgi:nucleoside-diphosphate-sugar epimerase